MINDLLPPARTEDGLSVAEDITGVWGHYHLVDADRPKEALCGARTTGVVETFDWGVETFVEKRAGARETFCVKCDPYKSEDSTAVLDVEAMREVNALFEGLEYK